MSGPSEFSESTRQSKDGVMGLSDHLRQGGDDGEVRKFLSCAETNGQNGLEIRFLVEDFNFGVLRQIDHEIADRGDGELRRNVAHHVVPNQATHLGDTELDANANRKNEMVLVAFVQDFDGVEVLVPARIRFEQVYLAADLFSGEVHLSCRDGTTKAVTRSLGKGESDAIRYGCLVAHHSEADVVERCAEVVNRVADDEREICWNCMLGLDVNQSPRRVYALPDSQFERAVLKVVGDLPVKVIDVLLGPL